MNPDLFSAADRAAVLHGDAHSKMQWSNGTNQIYYYSIPENDSRRYLIFPGTGFVVVVDGVTDVSHRCGVWRGGLMGELVAGVNSLNEALLVVRKQIPPHVIHRLQQESGYYSGRRKSV